MFWSGEYDNFLYILMYWYVKRALKKQQVVNLIETSHTYHSLCNKYKLIFFSQIRKSASFKPSNDTLSTTWYLQSYLPYPAATKIPTKYVLKASKFIIEILTVNVSTLRGSFNLFKKNILVWRAIWDKRKLCLLKNNKYGYFLVTCKHTHIHT